MRTALLYGPLVALAVAVGAIVALSRGRGLSPARRRALRTGGIALLLAGLPLWTALSAVLRGEAGRGEPSVKDSGPMPKRSFRPGTPGEPGYPPLAQAGENGSDAGETAPPPEPPPLPSDFQPWRTAGVPAPPPDDPARPQPADGEGILELDEPVAPAPPVAPPSVKP